MFKFKETLDIHNDYIAWFYKKYLPELSIPIAKNQINLIDIKIAMYQKLRGKSFENIKYPVTNIENQTVEWYDMKLVYQYTRQGLFIHPNNSLKDLYDVEFKSETVQTLMLSSCQAATKSLLYVLLKLYDSYRFDHLERLFYETKNIIKIFKKEFKENETTKIFYLDSGDKNFCFPESLDNEKIYIVDTTCIFKGDKSLKTFINNCLQQKVMCILTRSHLKLDGFGEEYAPLGSLTVLNAEKFPIPKANHFVDEGEDFMTLLIRFVSLNAFYTQIENIYPFLNSQELLERQLEKRNRLFSTYDLIQEWLKDEIDDIVFYNNKLFFTFPIEILRKDIIPFQLIKTKALKSVRDKTSFPIFFTDSFGFDFFAVSVYADYNIETPYATCRVAVGDISPNDLKQCKDFFINLIKSLRTN